MKVRDLLSLEIDIDVADEVTDDLYIAFCGPMELTDEGKAHFADVLDFEVSFHRDIVIVHVDDPVESVWEANLDKAKELFEGMAGYCSCSDYDRWFKEEDE